MPSRCRRSRRSPLHDCHSIRAPWAVLLLCDARASILLLDAVCAPRPPHGARMSDSGSAPDKAALILLPVAAPALNSSSLVTQSFAGEAVVALQMACVRRDVVAWATPTLRRITSR